MKKIITKKLQADNDSVPSPEQVVPPTPSYEPHPAMAESPSPGIYPPLPAEPPLPVDPPLPSDADAHPPLVVPKREIIDDASENSSNAEQEQMQLNNDILQNIKVEPSKTEEMCRDWVRGTCTRDSCRYSHVHDLSQLPRVYKFCHDYQNKGCVLSKCKFVHATVHEQEVFIRTGVMPPHALAHLKGQNCPPQSPQPPLPPRNAPQPGPSGQHLHRNVVMNPNPMPSTSRARMDRPSTSSHMNHGPMPSVAGPSGVNTNGRMLPPVPRPNWTGDPTCSTPEEGCRNCVVMEHRVQHAKNNLANINNNLERSANELQLLDQKEKRLMAVMNLWFQTNGVPKNYPNNNPNNNNHHPNQ